MPYGYAGPRQSASESINEASDDEGPGPERNGVGGSNGNPPDANSGQGQPSASEAAQALRDAGFTATAEGVRDARAGGSSVDGADADSGTGQTGGTASGETAPERRNVPARDAAGLREAGYTVDQERVQDPDPQFSQPAFGDGIGEQAAQLEQRAIEQTAGIDDPSQVRVQREGDTLQASLTQSGRQALQKQYQQGAAFGRIGAVSQGEQELQREVREARNRQRVEEAQEGGGATVLEDEDAGTVDSELEGRVGEDPVNLTPVRDETEQQLAEQFSERTGENITTEDIIASRTGDGNVTATLDRSGRVKTLPERDERDIFSGVVSGTEDVLSQIAQVSGGPDTRVEFRGEGSVVNVARRERVGEEYDLTADLGAVSDAGDEFTQLGENVSRDIIGPTAKTTGPTVGAISTPGMAATGAEAVGDATGADTLAQVRGARVRREFGRGFVEGGLEILNLPALGGTVVDAAEFGVEGASRTAQGRGGEFAEQAAGQGALVAAQLGGQAADNPIGFTGMVGGGLATSAGAIGGAQRLAGPRTGRAVSFGIQPGEELAISAYRRGIIGSRAARAFPGVRKGHLGTKVEGDATGPELSTRDPTLPEERAVPLEAADVDEAMGVSGPSRRARLRGAIERSRVNREVQALRSDLQERAVQTRENLKTLAADERGQVPASRPAEPEVDERVDDRFRGESEVRRAALEQREFRDFQELEQPRTEAAADEALGGISRRVDEAQRTSFEDDTDLEGRVEDTSLLRTAQQSEVALAAAAARERDEALTGVGVEPGFDTRDDVLPDVFSDVGTDTLVDTMLDQEARLDTRQEQRSEARQETGFETRYEPLTEQRTELRQEPPTEIRTEPPTEFRSEPPLEFDLGREGDRDDEDELPAWLREGETFDTGVAQSLDEAFGDADSALDDALGDAGSALDEL